MKKYVFVLALMALIACQQNKNASTEVSNGLNPSTSLDTIRLALDWTPNVLHAGILLAEQAEWFKEEGIYLKWDTPEIDNYTKKPIFRLLDQEVDFAVGPSEHLFAFAADSNGVRAQAVATILQADRSAFVLKADAQVNSPAEIKDAIYLGYHTPLEHEVLNGMIRNDGGEPAYQIQQPGRLQVWDVFKQDLGQVAWVFLHWEAAMAKREGIDLVSFIPNDYGVPYGYSSVIMAPTSMDSTAADRCRRMLKVLARAYAEVARNPSESLVKIRASQDHDNWHDSIFVQVAMEDIHLHFMKGKTWGVMQEAKWQNYATWMREQGLLELSDEQLQQLYTNMYLP
tara:strand:- start:9844 stop:10866 length:1023 start_codon:yes stop_codon:yes gene_type:complete